MYLSLYINLRQGALFSKKNEAHVGILNMGRLNYFIDIKNKAQKTVSLKIKTLKLLKLFKLLKLLENLNFSNSSNNLNSTNSSTNSN